MKFNISYTLFIQHEKQQFPPLRPQEPIESLPRRFDLPPSQYASHLHQFNRSNWNSNGRRRINYWGSRGSIQIPPRYRNVQECACEVMWANMYGRGSCSKELLFITEVPKLWLPNMATLINLFFYGRRSRHGASYTKDSFICSYVHTFRIADTLNFCKASRSLIL